MRRIRLFLTLALLVLAGAPVLAQDGEDFQALRWSGGTLQAEVGLGLNLNGVGVGSGTFGGLLSGRVDGGAASLFGNPALLASVPHHQVSLGSRVGFSTSSFGIDGTTLLAPGDVASSTDDFLTDLNLPGEAPVRYTDAQSLRAAQQGQLASFAFAYPVHRRFVVGIGARTPFQARMDLRLSGLETLLRAGRQTGDQTIDIKVLLNLNAGLALDLQMNTLTVGAGGVLMDGRYGQLTAGVALNRHEVNHRLALDVRPEGMVLLNGSQEYFFNDASDPNLNAAAGETNAFYVRAQGNYRDVAWGARLGVQYLLPSRHLGLSLTHVRMPTFALTDATAAAERFLPVFLDPEGVTDPGPDEAELLDVEAIRLAKPNLTRATSDTLAQVVGLELPSSTTIGLDLGLGRHTLAVNYALYSGALAYKSAAGGLRGDAGRFKVGKTLTSGVRVGFEAAFPEKLRGAAWALVPIRLLFLDLDGLLLQALGKHTGYAAPRYRIAAGVLVGEGLVEDVEGDLAADLDTAFGAPLPAGVSLGRQYTVFDQLDVGVMLFGVPDLALRVALAYTLR